MNGVSTTRNAIFAAVQSFSGGVIYFFLYRYLLQTIGSEEVGMWAVVLSIGSASRMTELGFSGSAVKFIAKYIARDDLKRVVEVLQTTLASIAVILVCVLIFGYPLLSWIITKLIPRSKLGIALDIFPLALVSVWISAISGVFLAALDGCQRIDIRASIQIIAGPVFFILTLILVPLYGLYGIAWSQIGQGAFMLLAGYILLKQQFTSVKWSIIGWNYNCFREMFVYGINFQIVSVSSMLIEPVTKAFMALFGGLSVTAYYEMAHRMITQFRSLLVSAYQAMVPKIAILQEKAPEKINAAYTESYKILFFLALPLYTLIIAITPLISELWIGYYEPRFMWFAVILAIGWWINTHNVPAYFVNLGTGILRWNTVGHIINGILNVVLGYVLGLVFGAMGVVTGYVLALIAGSVYIIIKYHLDNKISFTELLPRESRSILMACILGLLISSLFFHLFSVTHKGFVVAVLNPAIYVASIIFSFWKHPLRSKIALQITAGFTRKR